LSTSADGIRRCGEVQVIRLSGSLTLGAPVDDLRQTLEQALGAGDANLVLNLSDFRWIDSSGIGVLVKSLTTAKQSGGSLKLVNPSKPALQTLKMCSLLPLFEVYMEESDAVQSFA
jgi:anti-sigma B factor antagonist